MRFLQTDIPSPPARNSIVMDQRISRRAVRIKGKHCEPGMLYNVDPRIREIGRDCDRRSTEFSNVYSSR